jgi:hypothetical protein
MLTCEEAAMECKETRAVCKKQSKNPTENPESKRAHKPNKNRNQIKSQESKAEHPNYTKMTKREPFAMHMNVGNNISDSKTKEKIKGK